MNLAKLILDLFEIVLFCLVATLMALALGAITTTVMAKHAPTDQLSGPKQTA